MSIPTQSPIPRDQNYVPLQGVYFLMTSGVQTVTTSGTPVALIATSTECKRIDIVAQSGNSGICYIGGTGTLASAQRGVPLSPLGSYTFFVTDVNTVLVDSTFSGDKVSFVYFD